MGYLPQRRHSRFEFHRFPWVFSIRLAAASWPDRPTRVEPKNISRGGTKFLSNRKFQVFENLHVALFDKDTGKSLVSLLGKVVRVEEIDTGYGERTYGIAIEFLAEMDTLAPLLPAEPSSSPAT